MKFIWLHVITFCVCVTFHFCVDVLNGKKNNNNKMPTYRFRHHISRVRLLLIAALLLICRFIAFYNFSLILNGECFTCTTHKNFDIKRMYLIIKRYANHISLQERIKKNKMKRFYDNEKINVTQHFKHSSKQRYSQVIYLFFCLYFFFFHQVFLLQGRQREWKWFFTEIQVERTQFIVSRFHFCLSCCIVQHRAIAIAAQSSCFYFVFSSVILFSLSAIVDVFYC